MTYQKLQDDKAENIRRLFWTVYVFDKNASLLLGKASQLQDCEIDTKYPSLPLDVSLRPWDESFILGIKLASLQGKIYSDLYSAGSASRSAFEGAETISEIGSSMEQWRADLESVSRIHQQGPENQYHYRFQWLMLFPDKLHRREQRASICLDPRKLGYHVLFDTYHSFPCFIAAGNENRNQLKMLSGSPSVLEIPSPLFSPVPRSKTSV